MTDTMSDHGEQFDDTRYSTPVPELDDHRYQSMSVQRPEHHSRRGTVDTLYGPPSKITFASDLDAVNSALHARDFEHAIVDEDGRDVISPTMMKRERRDTYCTQGSRSESPPNSVKAFALARRRERGQSISGQSIKGFPDVKRLEENDLHRTASINSRQSRRSRRFLDTDAVSLASSIKSAEEDVCFPQAEYPQRDKNRLHIDFEYLERWVEEEEEREAAAKAETRVFNDLRKPSQNQQMASSDGDFIQLPSTDETLDEKSGRFTPADRATINQDPTRFSFFSSAWESTIHASDFGDLIMPGETLSGLFTLPEDEPDGVWWLHMNNPTREEISAICKGFGVHPLTSEDIGFQETREKIELFPSYYFACFRSFRTVMDDGEPELEPFNIYVVVFREGTLSFSFAPNPHAANVRYRIGLLKEYVSLSSDWICYALIDDIVDCFAPSIQKIEKETDIIEDQVFIARTDDMHTFLRQIGVCRKITMGLMKLLGGKADVLRGFTKRCNENYNVTPHMDVGMYLGDIQDHVVTMMSNLNHYEKMLSRAHSNYLAQLSIDNITQGNRANKVLSKITLLASILVPLNLVCGLFGMNVHVPYGGGDNLIPFFTIVASLVLLTIISLGVARKYRYI